MREDIPIRQLSLILETLGDHASRIRDPIWLTEYIRHRLVRNDMPSFSGCHGGYASGVTIDPSMEDRIAAGAEHSDRAACSIRMSPAAVEITCRQIAQQVKKLESMGRPPIVLVSPKIRPALRQITLETLPELRIISYNEIARGTDIESVALVADPVPA